MRIFILILTLLAYPLVAHGMIINGIPGIAVVLLVSMGLLSISFGLSRGPKQKTEFLKIIIYTVIILWGIVNLLSDSIHVLYVPSITINFLISLVIASSLREGATPLMEEVIRMSAIEELPDLVKREARVLTIIWVGFFLLMALASLALAVWSDLSTWSLFANVLYFVFLGLVIILMHGYEHVRYRKLGVPISWSSAHKMLHKYSASNSPESQAKEGSR